MKKFLSALVFVIVCGIFNFCSAQDIWFYKSGKTDFYFSTDNINEDDQLYQFTLYLKHMYDNNGVMKKEKYQFVYISGKWYFTPTNSSMGWESVKESILFVKLFEVCAPYVSLVRKYPHY